MTDLTDYKFWRKMYLDTMQKLIATEKELNRYRERERQEQEERDRWMDKQEALFLAL